MKSYKHPFLGEAELRLVKEVLDSGELSGFKAGNNGGSKVNELEERFADYIGVKYAVSMNSATSCLHTACIIGDFKDKEVITTPMSFTASASCILMVGGIPKFVDVEDTYFSNGRETIGRGISKETRGVLLVHLAGHPVTDCSALGAFIIEDCSQALGARIWGRSVGTFGDCGVFSFNQHKHITSGEGGMLVTDNEEIANKAKLIRNHAETQTDYIGYNFRMTELQAAVLIPQLERIEELVDYRINLTGELSEILKDYLIVPDVHEGCRHSFYTYNIRYLGDRDELQKRLKDKGVYFGQGGGYLIYDLPLFEKYKTNCVVAERLVNKEMMFTDILRYPMTIKDVRKMGGIIKDEL